MTEKICRILIGSIDGHMVVLNNGKLLFEVTDRDPIDNRKFTKAGFKADASQVRIRNIFIRQIKWKNIGVKYKPEF